MTYQDLTTEITREMAVHCPGSEWAWWGDYRAEVGAPDVTVTPAVVGHWLGTVCAELAIDQLATTEPERTDTIMSGPTMQPADIEYVREHGGSIGAADDAYRATWARLL